MASSGRQVEAGLRISLATAVLSNDPPDSTAAPVVRAGVLSYTTFCAVGSALTGHSSGFPDPQSRRDPAPLTQ